MKNIRLSNEVLEIFNIYEWSGNVRELRNIIESSFNIACDSEEIEVEHLPCYLVERLKNRNVLSENNEIKLSYSDIVDAFEKKLISDMLKKTSGNVSKASKILRIKRQTLQHKIKRLNI